MDIYDVDALIIADNKGNMLLKKNFTLNSDLLVEIVNKSIEENDLVFYFKDKLIFRILEGELCIVIVSNINNNEVLLGYSFEQFNIALETVLKKYTKEAVYKKYDVMFSLVDLFVYEGIIAENKAEKLIENLPKRSFEGIDGMKVPKGIASAINNASKSFTRYI